MSFVFSRHGLNRRDQFLQRFFEILPGATSWSLLLGMTALSFSKPVLAAIIIIAFYVYWIMRVIFAVIFLILAYFRLSLEKKTDWMARLEAFENPETYERRLKNIIKASPLKRKISLWIHLQEMRDFCRRSVEWLTYSQIYHLVLIPVANEGKEILEPAIRSLRTGTYPVERMMVVIALEMWASAEVKTGVYGLCQKYQGVFMDFRIVEHPEGLPGEARVKGANITWAAMDAARDLARKDIAPDHVIVSCFDADTVVSSDYFACLTYTFLACPERQRASFQPVPVYHNNIWSVPHFAKVLETSSSFFILVETTNPDKLVTFSSHSMSFKALVDIGYWPVDMISDDSLIFWKALIHYDGDYRVVPMYVTVSMDVVDAGHWLKTAQGVYRQKRRWAWGVEGFPLVMRGFLQMEKLSLPKRIAHVIKMFEGHVMWATWSFLLMVIGWLPAVLATREYSGSVVYYSSSRISSVIFSLSYFTLFVLISLSLALLPRKRMRYGFFKRCLFALQWFLLPWINVFFAAMPALDAQTRLMLGRYMEFWVADKRRALRKKPSLSL